LKNIPVGTLIHNIELVPGKGGQLARSAGAYAQLLKTNATGYATVFFLFSFFFFSFFLSSFFFFQKMNKLINK